MARQLKPLSAAIRELLAKSNGTITFADAAPKLVEAGSKRGFEVPENPGPKSEDLGKMEAYDQEIDWENDTLLQKYADACGLSDAAIKRCKREAAARKAWSLFANTFNVAKNKWAKEQGGVSKRPKTSKNAKARAAKVQQVKRGRGRPRTVSINAVRRGRPRMVQPVLSVPSDLDDFKAFEYVEGHGGVAAVRAALEKAQSQLEQAQAEVNDLARVLEGHARLGQRYESTQKAKAKAAVA